MTTEVWDGRCGAVAQIKVGAVVVTELRCGLDSGHGVFGIRHSVELEWTDDAVITLPDADLLDPAEPFDVEVPLTPPWCSTCGSTHGLLDPCRWGRRPRS